ncbi:MAG: hypothetical protein ACOCP4_00840 [Candidatus Woesearchaeota archaeon]
MYKIKINEIDGFPLNCPNCNHTRFTIDNSDGLICQNCGCWYDCDDEGELLYAYEKKPASLI